MCDIGNVEMQVHTSFLNTYLEAESAGELIAVGEVTPDVWEGGLGGEVAYEG